MRSFSIYPEDSTMLSAMALLWSQALRMSAFNHNLHLGRYLGLSLVEVQLQANGRRLRIEYFAFLYSPSLQTMHNHINRATLHIPF